MEYDKIIAVDFDGTLCESKWPEIGEPNEEVINYVKEQRLFYGLVVMNNRLKKL